MSVISPVESHDHEGSPMSKEEKLRWEGFVEKVGFEPYAAYVVLYLHAVSFQSQPVC